MGVVFKIRNYEDILAVTRYLDNELKNVTKEKNEVLYKVEISIADQNITETNLDGKIAKYKIDRKKLYELMNTYCNSNYNEFARALNVYPSHIHKYMVKGEGGGVKITGAILMFCASHNLNFYDYLV